MRSFFPTHKKQNWIKFRLIFRAWHGFRVTKWDDYFESLLRVLNHWKQFLQQLNLAQAWNWTTISKLRLSKTVKRTVKIIDLKNEHTKLSLIFVDYSRRFLDGRSSPNHFGRLAKVSGEHGLATTFARSEALSTILTLGRAYGWSKKDVGIFSHCYWFSCQYTTAALFIFGLALNIWTLHRICTSASLWTYGQYRQLYS